MQRQAKEFQLSNLDGISERQIAEHMTLYQGYVKKLNEIMERLPGADRAAANQNYSEIRELKLEQPFNLNAIMLHEAYFGNLGGKGSEPSDAVRGAMERYFGSLEKWEEDLKAAGMAARGWVVTAFNWDDGQVYNISMDRHDIGALWSGSMLVVLDTYEHAYFLDYGSKRAPYLEAFLRNLNWDEVNRRVESTLRMAGVGA